MTEKLQKVLARAGLGSRRELEAWIGEGRVSVNGRRATLGDRVGPADALRIDGRPVGAWRTAPRPARVIAYHKPAGELCTRSDPQGRPTVFERLPRVRGGRWVSIGRLDANTSGLLLFTDDGELAHRLMHPSRGVEREYAVRVRGEASPEMLERLRRGVDLEDGPAAFERIDVAGGDGVNRWYHVLIREGRNREVRRLWDTTGLTVSRLIRVRYGPVSLPRSLRAGRWSVLEKAEFDALLACAGLDPARPVPRPRRARTPWRRR